MKKHAAYVLGVAAIMLLQSVVACADSGPDVPAPSPTATAAMPATSCDGTELNYDIYCLPGAKNGTPCTQDCCYSQACGIGNKGYKLCTCPSGVYEWCVCAPPPEWPTLPPGGDCSPQGVSGSPPPAGLQGAECHEEWKTCFTADAGRGCICLREPTTQRLNLVCGSVGTWFKKINDVDTTY